MNKLTKADAIIEYFKNRDLDPESREYLRYHSLRYQYLLEEVDQVIKRLRKKKLKVLDIGAAYQTEVFRHNYPQHTINSLGFHDTRFKKRKGDQHWSMDLNNAQYKEKWLKLPEHDLVIMAELIEHLYTSPKLVLDLINSWMKKGGILIIQTPNAVSLDRRLKMILGKHPYEMIREQNINPGHFREYTLDELIEVAEKSGFKVKEYRLGNYFLHKNLKGKIYDALCNLLPNQFKHGITLILVKN